MKIVKFGKGQTLEKCKLKKDISTEQKSRLFPIIVLVIGVGMILVGVLMEIGIIC